MCLRVEEMVIRPVLDKLPKIGQIISVKVVCIAIAIVTYANVGVRLVQIVDAVVGTVNRQVLF